MPLQLFNFLLTLIFIVMSALSDGSALRGDVQMQSPHSKAPRNHSTFNLSHRRLFTPRFGEITPFYSTLAYPKDKFTMRSNMDIQGMNMNSPILQDLIVKKDYYQVPMEAILPMNWNLIFTNPVKGDDVPVDANCVLSSSTFKSFFSSFLNLFPAYRGSQKIISVHSSAVAAAFLLHWLDDNSLQKALGYDFASSLFVYKEVFEKSPKYLCFKYWEDLIKAYFDAFKQSNAGMFIPGIGANLSSIHFSNMSIHQFKEFLLTYPEAYPVGVDNISVSINEISPAWFNLDGFAEYTNLAKLFAYQIVYYHFHTNDKIDFIYSAELYRSMMRYPKVFTDFVEPTFVYNGRNLSYDSLSGKFISSYITSLSTLLAIPTVVPTYSTFSALLAYFDNIFGLKHSLRYLDRFTGSRSQPLAAGDTSVDVNSGSVSVLDITKQIQTQRFLNEVNRSGRKFGNYIKGLFGDNVAYDWHDPKFLASTTDNLGTFDTRNTSDAQQTAANSTSSQFSGSSHNFAFEVEIDRPSILLGVIYFDITRLYAHSIDRVNLIEDRYDMYNPFFEYIGDQALYLCEYNSQGITAPTLFKSPFAYEQRFNEYKKAINLCVGAFIDYLPTWRFVDSGKQFSGISNITPEFIRSYCYELDKYFRVLGDNSNYFHFLVDCFLDVTARRNMAFNPSIL